MKRLNAKGEIIEADELSEARTQYVVKANELIQRSRFSLSTQQQKIVLYLISRIKPTDDDFKTYSFSISDFCKVCGIDHTNGKYYVALKQAIQDIADKSLWVRTAEDRESLIRWISAADIDSGNGNITIRLDENMKPYLLHLKENFTKYELIWTLKFKSKYSIRLYELLKSFHYNELQEYTKEFTLEDLKKRLDAEKYDTWQHFKDRVLEPSKKEINAYSDKEVEYEPIKEYVLKNGKYRQMTTRAKFTIKTKDLNERNRLYDTISDELGYGQLMLKGWELDE